MAKIAVEPQVVPSSRRKRALWIEFVIVILYLVVPTAFTFFATKAPVYSSLYYIYLMLYALGRIGIVLFVVWVADGSFNKIGIAKPRVLDLSVALGIISIYGFIVFAQAHFETHGHVLALSELINGRPLPRPTVPIWLALAQIVFYSAEREVLARGYAIGRLTELSNEWIAVIASAILFTGATLSRGLVYFCVEFLLALLFGVAFCVTRRLWAGFLTHVAMYTFIIVTVYAMSGGGIGK